MRRFEFSQGGSNKFWQVEQVKTTVVTQWGRIGTAGQAAAKELGTEDAARKTAEKLIAEKLAKGYVEVTASGPSKAPSAKGTDVIAAAQKHFQYLCDTPGYETVFAEVMSRVSAMKTKGDTVIVEFAGDDAWTASPPATADKLKGYPKSYQAVAKNHATIKIGKDLVLCAPGYLDFSNYDEDDPVYLLFKSAKNVREALYDYIHNDTVWVYHPTQRNTHGEPALFPIQHELENEIDPIDANVGALFLNRVVTRNQWPIDLPELRVAKESSKPKSKDSWTSYLVWALPKKGERLYHKEDGPLDERQAKAILGKTARMMLKGLPALSMLPLAQMPALVELDVYYAGPPIADTLDGIEAAKTLQSLNAKSRGLKDLSPLSVLSQLETLGLGENKIRDLAPLAACRKLQTLYLQSNPITDVRPLAQLGKLKTLWLSDTSVRDILPLASLPKLTSLAVPLKLPKENLAAFKKQRPDVEIPF